MQKGLLCLLAVSAAPLVFAGSQSLEDRCLIPGVSPGPASAKVEGGSCSIGNNALKLTFACGEHVGAGTLSNVLTGSAIDVTQLFSLVSGAQNLSASDFVVTSAPKVSSVGKARGSSQLAARLGGKRITMRLTSGSLSSDLTLSLVLLDNSNYIREELTLTPRSETPLTGVTLVDVTMPGGAVRGNVPGSPIANDTFFCGFEHPMSESKVDGEHAFCSIARKLPLMSGAPVTYSSVFGVSTPGQLRRGFLNYVERERARPYQPFLHYNSWYDIGYFTPYNEADCLDSINSFGEELVRKRGVKMDSFLFDDGWDNYKTVWEFHSGFPKGFLPLKETAAKYGAAPGIWLSPWGGYGPPRDQRLKTGKAAGMEIDSEGYALSGPKYFERFRNVCLDLVTKYGINQFKFDGTGSPDKQYPGSAYASDFDAAIQLIKDLRTAKPGLFINLTTGTWPSPFWLRYADSTWRGGEDHSFAGVGTKRQQWITYRDGDTYNGVVQKGQLYPLTSLMLHGLIYAKHAHDLTNDPAGDFPSEVHDYFGNGTQLQEMYISHGLLKPEDWDVLAEAANWSRANSDVLVDTHWIGGDPTKLQVYGWASWSPRMGILVLRNPDDKTHDFDVDVQSAFELPDSYKGTFASKSPWKGVNRAPENFAPGHGTKIWLKPFEVLVLNLIPEGSK